MLWPRGSGVVSSTPVLVQLPMSTRAFFFLMRNVAASQLQPAAFALASSWNMSEGLRMAESLEAGACALHARQFGKKQPPRWRPMLCRRAPRFALWPSRKRAGGS